MNVAELIEWLKTQDQEAIVKVVTKVGSHDYFGDEYSTVELDVSEHADYFDMRDADCRNNRRTLTLGAV